MRLRRRSLLLSTGALVTASAGCTNSDSEGDGGGSSDDNFNDNSGTSDADGDGVRDSLDDYPNDSSRSKLVNSEDDTRNIEEDHWRYYELNLPQSGHLSYDYIVRDGPSIDAIVIDESEYGYFKENERYNYYPELSTLDSIGESMSGPISSGTYYLIFDNSERGEAYPPSNMSNDVANVEFSFKAVI
jgi:hypothetical protein